MSRHLNVDTPRQFVDWFRNSAPYINAFRGRTFVVVFGGEVLEDGQFPTMAHDLALLNSLGIRLVLVHGARPQIEQRLQARGAKIQYVNGIRVTDETALTCVKEAAGAVRVELEALLSMGLANTPMAGARIRTASGNCVTARPIGVREGIDYRFTGEVRRVDVRAIEQQLSDGAIVLLSPIGYSPTGEVFNIGAQEVASAAAIALGADKLIALVEGPGLRDGHRRLMREMTLAEAERLAGGKRRFTPKLADALSHAIRVCGHGVRRAHIIDRGIDGALLRELFTLDGIGTMITTDLYEGIRPATIEDVGGILQLIEPLEKDGVLVRRSRELLEMEIDRFTLIERDGMIIGCVAVYGFSREAVGELACLAVHPHYQRSGYGNSLLYSAELKARQLGLKRLFVLTTRAIHWFQERGFGKTEIENLPLGRQKLYNYKRGSKVLWKAL